MNFFIKKKTTGKPIKWIKVMATNLLISIVSESYRILNKIFQNLRHFFKFLIQFSLL